MRAVVLALVAALATACTNDYARYKFPRRAPPSADAAPDAPDAGR